MKKKRKTTIEEIRQIEAKQDKLTKVAIFLVIVITSLCFIKIFTNEHMP